MRSTLDRRIGTGLSSLMHGLAVPGLLGFGGGFVGVSERSPGVQTDGERQPYSPGSYDIGHIAVWYIVPAICMWPHYMDRRGLTRRRGMKRPGSRR